MSDFYYTLFPFNINYYFVVLPIQNISSLDNLFQILNSASNHL